MSTLVRSARPVWLALGIALVIANHPWSLALLGLSAILWIPGFWLASSDAVARAFGEALRRPGVVRLASVLLLLGALGVVALGPLGGLLLVTGLSLPILLAARTGADRLIEAGQGIGLSACMIAVLLGGVEFLLNRPRLADRLGTPAARVRWESRYDSLWVTNPFGFRSRHATVARRPGTPRILAIGDSYTWGDKIAASESLWTSRLEERLSGTGPVEVINAAQRGWTTANEAEFLGMVGWQFEPDLVVVQFFANDALPSTAGLGREGERWVRIIPSRMRDFPVGRSALAYTIERVLNQWRVGRDPQGGYSALYRDDAPGFTQLTAALRAMGDSSRARGSRVLLVLFPVFVPGIWTPQEYPLRDIHARVLAAASAAGLDTLDLAPRFAATGQEGRTWWALPWDSHPNEAAHRLAGDAVAEAIVNRGLLGERGSQPAAGSPAARRP